MRQDPVLSMLSLAQKAGAIASGEYAAEQAIKRGKAYLLILAEDASENTRRKFQNSASFYEIPVLMQSTKDVLGHMLGKGERSVAAVLDPGFSDSILKKANGKSEIDRR